MVTLVQYAAGASLAVFFASLPKKISGEVIIDAPPEVVYDTVVDVASYPSWNEAILRVEPQGVDVTKLNAEFTLVQKHLISSEKTAMAMRPIEHAKNSIGFLLYVFNGSNDMRRFLNFPRRTSLTQKFRPTADGCRTVYETVETFSGLGSSFSSFVAASSFKKIFPSLKLEAERRAAARLRSKVLFSYVRARFNRSVKVAVDNILASFLLLFYAGRLFFLPDIIADFLS